MAERISRKPDELAQQCSLAAFAIGTVPTWPPAAPSAATMTTCNSNLTSQLSVINSLETQLRAARQTLKGMIDDARDAMTKIDQATDLLYGPDGADKQNFGLPPKKAGQTASGTPEQVVITATTDGTHPAAENRGLARLGGFGRACPRFSDSYFALRTSYFRSMVGSATVTNSEMEIQGLERGKQYWFRVRAVRAGQVGPWSDQATRVANI